MDNCAFFFKDNFVSFTATPVSKLEQAPFRRFVGKVFKEDDITMCDICTESGTGTAAAPGGTLLQRTISTCFTCYNQMCITCKLRNKNVCAYCRTVNNTDTAMSASAEELKIAKKYLRDLM